MSRNVTSRDPRKPSIVAAFKSATGATRITLLHEVAPHTFTANCITVRGPSFGIWEVRFSGDPREAPAAYSARMLEAPGARVARSADEGIDGDAWAAICDEHHTFVTVPTIAAARSSSTLDFCDECRARQAVRS